MALQLGYSVGYWSSGPPRDALNSVIEAERLGFESVWTAEAYGSDALTPLAWWGASTSQIKLGTGIIQMSARTPSATAMAAMTIDHLSQGRFILGLGVSGPQVVEGWYGERYHRPLGRTREYVSIVRSILRRDEPVTHAGNQYRLPFDGEGRVILPPAFREYAGITAQATFVGVGKLFQIWNPERLDAHRKTQTGAR